MLFTCSKVHSGKECGKCATFKHLFVVAICRKQNHIFTEVLLKQVLQVRHVLMVAGEITAIFILNLEKKKSHCYCNKYLISPNNIVVLLHSTLLRMVF